MSERHVVLSVSCPMFACCVMLSVCHVMLSVNVVLSVWYPLIVMSRHAMCVSCHAVCKRRAVGIVLDDCVSCRVDLGPCCLIVVLSG